MQFKEFLTYVIDVTKHHTADEQISCELRAFAELASVHSRRYIQHPGKKLLLGVLLTTSLSVLLSLVNH
jgi:hypothetical protein